MFKSRRAIQARLKQFILILMSFFYSHYSLANFNFYKDFSMRPLDIESFGKALSRDIFSSKVWPTSISFSEKKYDIKYTFNDKLTKYIKKELKRYRSDYASVVVIDNNTGEVLSAVDYSRTSKKFGKNITFSSTNPAASIFKVITAAELIENSNVRNDSIFSYSGRATTLYKYQLKNKKNRWTRKLPFRNAFAYSNNVVFGKAAIANTDYVGLSRMANKFGFNKDNLQLIEGGHSKLYYDESDYGLAELASGFNRDTMISPVHGAIIASIVANDGILRKPTVISEIRSKKLNKAVWVPEYSAERVFSKKSARELRQMMDQTVKRGTARGAFRPWKIKKLKNVEIGGKTGTITGGLPYGKRDWFVSYAVPNNSKDKGISICVMIVNVEKWYIKSTVLAKNVIEHYYSKVLKNKVN